MNLQHSCYYTEVYFTEKAVRLRQLLLKFIQLGSSGGQNGQLFSDTGDKV